MIDETDELPTGSGQALQDIKQTAGDAAAAGKERFAGLREAAQSGLDEARSAAADTSEKAKATAAGEISRTAEGLEAAARELEGSPQHELLQEAADGLKQIARAVEGRSIGELAGELSDFGRRNPLAFLGGAAFAGFALARFARASAPEPGLADPAPGVPFGGSRDA
jgi:hypothetical protein